MNPSARNLTVVIRAAGERTAEACQNLVSQQVPAGTVTVVNERPFEKALRKTYEVGIESGAKWTMTLDADVLLRNGAVDEFLAAAEQMPGHYVQIEGRIHDKLTGLYRPAGHRIYRTSLLPRALDAIPEPGTEKRPEFSTLQKLSAQGAPSRRVGLVVGLHDHEQYFRDLYRKSFVHAKKFPTRVGEFAERWPKLSQSDDDFRIALKGLCDGLLSSAPVRIDVRAFQSELNELVPGLLEKAPLQTADIDFAFVERHLQLAGPAPAFETKDSSLVDQGWLRRRYIQVGPFRLIPLVIGQALCQVGERLKRAATTRSPT